MAKNENEKLDTEFGDDDTTEEPKGDAVATPLVPLEGTDPEEDAAKENGGENPDYPEEAGHEPDVDLAREV